MEIVMVTRIRDWVRDQLADALVRRDIVSGIAVVPSVSLDSGDRIDSREGWIENGLVRLQYRDAKGAVHQSAEYYDDREAIRHRGQFVDLILERIG